MSIGSPAGSTQSNSHKWVFGGVLLTAIATIVAAFITGKSQGANSQVTIINQQIETISSLQSSLSAAESTPSTADHLDPTTVTVTETVSAQSNGQTTRNDSSSDPVNAPNVRRQGSLTILPGSNANQANDFDSQASDPDWGRNEPTGDGINEGPYLGQTDFRLYSPGDPGLKFLGTDEPSYSACSSVQLYSNQSTPIGEMAAGTSFCLRTSAGRYASLTVTKEATPQEVDLAVTVWEKS